MVSIKPGTEHPEPGGIVHADHGTQFTSWVFGEKIRSAGLLPSLGFLTEGFDVAVADHAGGQAEERLVNVVAAF
ncbi:hypothetical protein SAMN05421507_1575, partial [Lentzea jiangxiensis]